MVRGDVQSHCCCCRFHLLMKVYLHFSFSVRWGCLGRPVSQRTLPALCGSPLPEPLNVAPSFVFTSCEGDSCKDFEPLSTIFRFRPVIWDVMFWLVPLEYICGNGHRNGKIGKRTKTFLIYPQKMASLEESQRSSVNFKNMPYINDCTYPSQQLVLKRSRSANAALFIGWLFGHFKSQRCSFLL